MVNREYIPLYWKGSKGKFKDLYEYLDKYLKMNYPETYTDKEFQIIQCYSGRNRSVDDLYAISKVFDENITFEEVCKTLVKIVENNQDEFGIWRCPDIYRIIVYKKIGHQASWGCSYPRSNPAFSEAHLTTDLNLDDDMYKGVTMKEFIEIVEKV